MRFYDQIGAKEKARSYNLQMFREYEALARKHHVQIALENMFLSSTNSHASRYGIPNSRGNRILSGRIEQ